jgi:hypothetical protein
MPTLVQIGSSVADKQPVPPRFAAKLASITAPQLREAVYAAILGSDGKASEYAEPAAEQLVRILREAILRIASGFGSSEPTAFLRQGKGYAPINGRRFTAADADDLSLALSLAYRIHAEVLLDLSVAAEPRTLQVAA